jgi:hypothetical protein
MVKGSSGEAFLTSEERKGGGGGILRGATGREGVGEGPGRQPRRQEAGTGPRAPGAGTAVRVGDLEEGVSDGWGPGYSVGQWGLTRVKSV